MTMPFIFLEREILPKQGQSAARVQWANAGVLEQETKLRSKERQLSWVDWMGQGQDRPG